MFLAVGGKIQPAMPNVFPTWTLTKSVYGIGATGSMAVSKNVDVGSSPTCCAQPTHMLWERSSEPSIVAALVLADPPSLREQSPESLRRLLFLDAWQSGLLHHLAKVATGNGPRVRIPQHPRAVAGGKKPFLPLDFLMAVWVDDRRPPCFW